VREVSVSSVNGILLLSLSELHSPKISVTTAHVESYHIALCVAWWQLQQLKFPLLWVPELFPVLATSFSQLQLSSELLVLVM
jgi:hypothetical protein